MNNFDIKLHLFGGKVVPELIPVVVTSSEEILTNAVSGECDECAASVIAGKGIVCDCECFYCAACAEYYGGCPDCVYRREVEGL